MSRPIGYLNKNQRAYYAMPKQICQIVTKTHLRIFRLVGIINLMLKETLIVGTKSIPQEVEVK
jgi:hypothetical protein